VPPTAKQEIAPAMKGDLSDRTLDRGRRKEQYRSWRSRPEQRTWARKACRRVPRGAIGQIRRRPAGQPSGPTAPAAFPIRVERFGVVLHQRARSGAAQPAGVQFPSPRDGGGIGVRLGCRGGAKPGYRRTGVISQQPSEPQQPHRILTAARWLRRYRKARFASGLHRAPTGLRLLRSSGLVFVRR
jgi:hypothetical protein